MDKQESGSKLLKEAAGIKVYQPGKIATGQPYISYEDYLARSGEPEIAEWVDGEVIIHMPPFYEHQQLVTFLSQLLGAFIDQLNLGTLLVAPFEVKLWPDGPSREPDLLYVSQANRDKLTKKRYEGGPDLVIEVISSDSVRRDRVDKFQEYEQAGVREYWLIDPRPNRQQADFFSLDESGRFIPADLDDSLFHSAVVPGFWLDVHWFWQEPLPATQLLLAQIISMAENASPELRAAYQNLHQLLSSPTSII